jgi:hypothetical protein
VFTEASFCFCFSRRYRDQASAVLPAFPGISFNQCAQRCAPITGFTSGLIGAKVGGMTIALTRRRDPNVSQECWRIHYGDVVVGSIAQSIGNPGAAPRWQWRCGFYPGSRPECTSGTADNFDEARTDFETAWQVFLAKRTEADFKAWRDQQAWTAEKYRRFDSRKQMPSDERPA